MQKIPKETHTAYNALVVGAGISGIRSALDLAQTGCRVLIIDKSPAMGGLLKQLDFQFPSNHCGMCRMLPLVHRDRGGQFCLRKGLFHENIDLILSAEISGLSGEPGNFTVKIHEKPTWVDPDRCVGCGLCETVCPETVPDCFNEGLSTHKAIYLPIPHSIPNPYVIDLAACTRCGACADICPTNAVLLSGADRKNFTILVVDDELSIRDSLKEWLEEEGFSVDMAASGAEALEKLKAHPFHLMLTDIKMPEMSGTDLLHAAKAAHPDLCVVMMTAYATVETAVEAMKTGAEDYLIKPFEPETLLPMVIRLYQDLEAARDREITAETIILGTGTSFYDPADKKNIFGYGIFPNVVTNIEFERLISHSGPDGGNLTRLDNGRPVKKIAWIQCVGSRDIQNNADYCSTICCMAAVKEALLAKALGEEAIETVIFYMDMRAWGKSFQRYVDTAVHDHQVRFERCKIHSLTLDEATGDLVVRYISTADTAAEETFDMVVLSVGQRPADKTQNLSRICDLPLTGQGFPETLPFTGSRTPRDGIFAAGSAAGLRDISESLILASAASREASRLIRPKGEDGGASPSTSSAASDTRQIYRDVSREPIALFVGICTCAGRFDQWVDQAALTRYFSLDPEIVKISFVHQVCTADGWESLSKDISASRANRVLIAACHPYVFLKKIRKLSRTLGLDPSLIDVVDIMTPVFQAQAQEKNQEQAQDQTNDEKDGGQMGDNLFSRISQGTAALKQADPTVPQDMPIFQNVLVIGAGIAGMTASLSIADAGFTVDLIETTDRLGGNLNWLDQTIDGLSLRDLMEETIAAAGKHPCISIHKEARLTSCEGTAGQFHSTIETGGEQKQVQNLEHGAVIVATGGHEAKTASFGHGTHPSIITQKALETRLHKKEITAHQMDTVVMILCVDSRKEPRNYCSRVCCPTALKQARQLRELNPETNIYILYRDMMTVGFSETFFTRARNDNVTFMAYPPETPPAVNTENDTLTVTLTEPVLKLPVEISADLVVLATGIVPELPDELAHVLGIQKDQDGFFQEAESKFRPLDAIREGIFACGIAHSPRSAPEAADMGRAAAQRALSLISNPAYVPDITIASVRHSLCSLCERCIAACPYGARMFDLEHTRILVNPLMCQGCGACAAVCPNDASVLPTLSARRMLGAVDAVFERITAVRL